VNLGSHEEQYQRQHAEASSRSDHNLLHFRASKLRQSGCIVKGKPNCGRAPGEHSWAPIASLKLQAQLKRNHAGRAITTQTDAE
jgi:hypothetical protein